MKDNNIILSAQLIYAEISMLPEKLKIMQVYNLAFSVLFWLIFKAKRKILFTLLVNKIKKLDFSNEIRMILDFRIVLKCFDHFDCNVIHDDPWYFLIGLNQCNFNSIRIVFDE